MNMLNRLKTLFDDKPFFNKLLVIALPIGLQNLMLALVAAADAIMLGKLDQNSMAAVSLATQVQFIQICIIAAITAGMGILGAQYWGKNDRKVIDEIFGMGMRQVAIVSVVFFIACSFYPHLLMSFFTNDPTLADIGCKYLTIASWSYLISGVSQCYLAVMKVSERVKRTAWISSVTVIINIILNSVFIFGLFGVPAMGARGAAVATVIARAFELLWCVSSSYEKGFIRFNPKMLFHWNKLLTLDFLRCASPIMASFIIWSVGFTSYTAIVGHLNSDAAAANSIAAVVRDLLCCICNGFCSAVGIVIGNELGAGQLKQAKIHGDKLMLFSFLCGFFCTIVMISTIPVVLRFMKLSEKAQEYLVGMFIIMAIYMIGRTVNTIMENGVFSAGGDTLFDTYSLIVSMWCIALPCAFIAAFWLKLPVLVVYACTCLDEVGKLPWMIHHYLKYKWVKNLTRN